MKSLRKSAMVAAAALATFSSAHAAWTFNPEDTFLAIKATGGQGNGIDLLYNLGSSTVLRDGGGRGVNIVNISTDLVAAYGAQWATRTDLFFGVVANRSNLSATGSNTTEPGGQDANRVLYLSRNASSPGSAALYDPGFNNGNSATATPYTGFRNALAELNQTAQANGVFSIDTNDLVNNSDNVIQNSFTKWTTSGSNDDRTFNVYASSQFLSQLGNNTTNYVDLQRVDSKTPFTTRYVASIGIDTSGNVSVIPEPSSIMLLGGAGAAALLRRRRSA